MNNDITVYTTMTCPVCGMVKEFLTSMRIEYKEVNVDLHPIELLKLIGKTRRFTVPQIHINGKWISGFDPVAILEEVNSKVN